MTDKLQQLTDKANELEDVEAEISRLEVELARAKKRSETIREKELVTLMEDVGMETFRTKSGLTIELGDKMYGHNLNATHAVALKWLRDHDQGGMIKTLLGIPFAKGSEADADALIDRLAGEGIVATKNVEVNAQTLKAAVRRMLEDGEAVPLKTLGIHTKTVAKVSK
jgi:hypothetical protein